MQIGHHSCLVGPLLLKQTNDHKNKADTTIFLKDKFYFVGKNDTEFPPPYSNLASNH